MSKKCFVYRLNDNNTGPEVLKEVFGERNWQPHDEEAQSDQDWNLWWRTSRFRKQDFETLKEYQRLNHYPRTTCITKKDGLVRNMRRMKMAYKSIIDFIPRAFNLPNEYTQFVKEFTRQNDAKLPNIWICKPADMSRGRGIFLFKSLGELQYDCNAVVQQYLSNPLTISGYKFDLRLYVVVPSFHPLRIYIYQDGLVRFGTEKFDMDALDNVYAHLTNTSINKNAPFLSVERERIGVGCKWSLTNLRNYFHQSHIDDRLLWFRISNIITLTILSQCTQMERRHNCFELYGFDVMLDSTFKPWLLEVNFSPSLNTDTNIDIQVKKPLLNDMLDMMEFSDKDMNRGSQMTRRGTRSRQPVTLKPPVLQLDTGLVRPQMSRGATGITLSDHSSRSEDDEPNTGRLRAGGGLPAVQDPLVYRRRQSDAGQSNISSASSYTSRARAQRLVVHSEPHSTLKETQYLAPITERRPAIRRPLAPERLGASLRRPTMKGSSSRFSDRSSTLQSNSSATRRTTSRGESNKLIIDKTGESHSPLERAVSTDVNDSGTGTADELQTSKPLDERPFTGPGKGGEDIRDLNNNVVEKVFETRRGDSYLTSDSAISAGLTSEPSDAELPLYNRERKDSETISLPNRSRLGIRGKITKTTDRILHTSPGPKPPVPRTPGTRGKGTNVSVPHLTPRMSNRSLNASLPRGSRPPRQPPIRSLSLTGRDPSGRQRALSNPPHERTVDRSRLRSSRPGADETRRGRLFPNPQREPLHRYGGLCLSFPFNNLTLKYSNAANLDVRKCVAEIKRVNTLAEKRFKQGWPHNQPLLQDTLLHSTLWSPLRSEEVEHEV